MPTILALKRGDAFAIRSAAATVPIFAPPERAIVADVREYRYREQMNAAPGLVPLYVKVFSYGSFADPLACTFPVT
jgi:hypothetical protein